MTFEISIQTHFGCSFYQFYARHGHYKSCPCHPLIFHRHLELLDQHVAKYRTSSLNANGKYFTSFMTMFSKSILVKLNFDILWDLVIFKASSMWTFDVLEARWTGGFWECDWCCVTLKHSGMHGEGAILRETWEYLTNSYKHEDLNEKNIDF